MASNQSMLLCAEKKHQNVNPQRPRRHDTRAWHGIPAVVSQSHGLRERAMTGGSFGSQPRRTVSCSVYEHLSQQMSTWRHGRTRTNKKSHATFKACKERVMTWWFLYTSLEFGCSACSCISVSQLLQSVTSWNLSPYSFPVVSDSPRCLWEPGTNINKSIHLVPTPQRNSDLKITNSHIAAEYVVSPWPVQRTAWLCVYSLTSEDD